MLANPLGREGRWGAQLLSRLLVRDKGLRDRLLHKEEALPWPFLNVLLRGTLAGWETRRRKVEEVSGLRERGAVRSRRSHLGRDSVQQHPQLLTAH